MTVTGPTPVLDAVYRRDAAALTRLLEGGARLTLLEAAFGGHQALAELLLAHGADAAAKNDDGQSPLDVAQAKGHATLARRLRGELP
ncbi:MAG TPA: ankyrin repeat domain-containing protein [Methylomirabilota bacterium]|jgi:hypothetical protein|nr:ankyrin repeat domain-containing protein [Methylomirabilota bacterium]